jgi:hypothetical protein
MLSIKQNFLETKNGGHPDRFVKQFEFLTQVIGKDPMMRHFPGPKPGTSVKDGWGVTKMLREDEPGAFPVLDAEHLVLPDITKWKEVLKMPPTDFPEEEWKDGVEAMAAIDRTQTYATVFYPGGIFERLHYLQGMENAMINFYEEPEATHEVIELETEYELKWAKAMIDHLHPDAVFHHDDWGSQKSTFMSRDQFQEFIKPAYMKIYRFYKENGVELIVHHADSYAAPFVPDMIDMGIDVWQGCMSTNNVPELVKQYGKHITFMGDLDSGKLDKKDWSQEEIDKAFLESCKKNGKLYFIPCLVQGGDYSTFPGVYDAAQKAIDKATAALF